MTEASQISKFKGNEIDYKKIFKKKEKKKKQLN